MFEKFSSISTLHATGSTGAAPSTLVWLLLTYIAVLAGPPLVVFFYGLVRGDDA